MTSRMTVIDIDPNKHAEELFTDEVEMIATVFVSSRSRRTCSIETEAHKTSP